MDLEVKKKLDKLHDIISGLKKVAVAFSGGVDSTLLLKATVLALPGRVAAVTLISPLTPPGEEDEARKTAAELGVEHIIIPFDPLKVEAVRTNARDRCYHCKSAILDLMRQALGEAGEVVIIDGSHADDLKEYRPGLKALKERSIVSPLALAGLTKLEIREASRQYGLDNWAGASQACLATRFPYDVELTDTKLKQVFEAEKILRREGFSGTRARHHGDILRLEIPYELFSEVLKEKTAKKLSVELERLGFRHVTMDLAGRRSGIFDQIHEEQPL